MKHIRFFLVLPLRGVIGAVPEFVETLTAGF